MLTAICPRIFPAISSTGDTAESSTSITRFDFSSTVCVSKRLAADHDAEDQQPREHERQRSD